MKISALVRRFSVVSTTFNQKMQRSGSQAAARWLALPVLLFAFCVGVRAQSVTASFAPVALPISVGNPRSMAVDSHGNVFVADTNTGTLVELPRSGTGYGSQQTVYSSGVSGVNVSAVAIDSADTLYVAVGDSTVSPNTTSMVLIPSGCSSTDCETTVLLPGVVNTASIAVDGNKNIYIADFGFGELVEFPRSGSSYGTPVAYGFGDFLIDAPYGMTVDANQNVYLADFDNGTITKVPLGCHSVACYVSYDSPGGHLFGIALDATGDLYVSSDVSVIRFPAGCKTSSCETTLLYSINSSGGLTFDAQQNLYIGSAGDGTVYEVSIGNFGPVNVGSTSASITLAFTFTSGGQLANSPYFVTAEGSLYDLNESSNIDFQATATQPPNACTAGQFYDNGDVCTLSVTFSPKYAGLRRGAMRLLGGSAQLISTVYLGGIGEGPQLTFPSNKTLNSLGGGFGDPSGVAVDGNGNVYVINGSVVSKILPGCTSAFCVEPLGGGFTAPTGVAVDGAGNLYVADSGTVVVYEMPAGCTSSSCVVPLSSDFSQPYGMAVDANGNVYVADAASGIYAMSAGCTSSGCMTRLGGGFNFPTGVAVDGSGNVYVADFGSRAVYEMPAGCASSACVTTLGSGFSQPYSVAVDGSGNVYVADFGRHAVYEMPAGCASSTCVTMLEGGLGNPSGVAVDGSGNVYVADSGNDAVYEMPLATPPSLSFATSTGVGSVDSTDGSQTATLANIGNQPLTFPVPTVGSNPSVPVGFIWNNASSCSQLSTTSSAATLAAGASCTIAVDFQPAAVGAVSGSAVVTDDALNVTTPAYATQSISLSGTGIAATVSVTVGTSPDGLAFSVDGTPYTTAQTFTWNIGDSHILTTTASQSGTGAKYALSMWSENGTNNILSLTDTTTASSSVTSYTANFDTTYLLTTAVNNSAYGSVIPAANNYYVSAGTVENLTATARAGYYFTGWTANADIADITNPSTTLTMNGPETATANFAAIPNFVVTTTADDTGTAGNCTPQTVAGTGTDASCSLRDALLQAASTGAGTISFDKTVFATAQTITLITSGTGLTLPSSTTVQGRTTGSGATLTNLVTVDGNRSVPVFIVDSGVTNATISNLTIANGRGGNGGGIYSAGALTVNNSTLSNNGAGAGGGIYNDGGVLTVNSSTLSGNAVDTDGAGIYNTTGTLTVSHSTFSGNSGGDGPAGLGAGIYNDSGTVMVISSTVSGNFDTHGTNGGVYNNTGSVTITNSIVSGNTGDGAAGDVSGSYTDGGGNQIAVSGINLAPLGNYGGPTQTMIALPGSPAICSAGTGLSTVDQRGFTRPTGYCSVGKADAGAVQSNYALVFTQQPSNTVVNTTMSPSPAVELTENGALFTLSTASVTGTWYDAITNVLGTEQPALSNGVATFSPISLSHPGTNDFIQAHLDLTDTVTISVSSNPFNAINIDHFAFTSLPGTAVAGTSFTGTVTAYTSTDNSQAATGYTGPVTFTSSDASAVLPGSTTLTAGVSGTLTFTLKTAGAQAIAVADSSGMPSTTSGNIAVSAATASVITAASTSATQSAVIGAGFANALQVTVVDAYGNPVGGNVVTFTTPSTGASVVLSALTCTTSTMTATLGTCSVTATANGTANSTAYTVSAKATGVTTASSFTLTNTAASPTLSVTASPTTLVYGQPVTITATSVPVSVGGSYPVGAVTFYDNATTLTPASTPVSGIATYSTTALTGSQTYAASTAADTNFNTVSKTSATAIIVGKASSTLAQFGGVQIVPVIPNTNGSYVVTVTGQYTGTGISTPSGAVGYTIPSPCAASCTGTGTISGGVILPVPSTLAPGIYNIAVTYGGDANYAAATGITVQVQVSQLTPTVTYPMQTAITYGAALTNNLNATTAYSTTSLTSGGTTAYTATISGGSPVAVTAATVLIPGTYTLTATWTPDSTNAATYKSASNTITLVVNKAPLTVTVNAATSVYGVAFPAFTGTLSGVVNGDGITASYSTTATPASLPGGSYSITAALSDPNSRLGNYNLTNTPAVLTISKAAVSVTFTQTAPTPITAGAGVGVPVTYAVLVTDVTANSTGTPGNTVQFYNGATAIGSPVTLINGAASFTYTFASAQSALITAVYSGDGNFNTATSAPLTEVVATPGYTVSANPTSLTITRGIAATATITFTPYGNYQGTATFSCTGLPAFSSCIFTPASVTFTGNNAVQTSTLQIYTLAPNATPGVSRSAILWVPGMMLAALVFFRRRKVGTVARGLLLAVLMVGMAFGVSGCGSNGHFMTPAGSDSVVVNVTATATAGSSSSNLNQTATISVTIQ